MNRADGRTLNNVTLPSRRGKVVPVWTHVWEWKTRYYRSGKYGSDTNSLLFMIIYNITTSLLLSVLLFVQNNSDRNVLIVFETINLYIMLRRTIM